MSVPEARCKISHCHVPETPCDHGEHDYQKDCPHFVSGTNEPAILPEQTTEFPWTGNTFGLDELSWLAARGRPKIFAPVGTYNAGKTTFLVALYLGLARRISVLNDESRFAGSYTLGGWENLAYYLRYPPHGIGPGFPPHTPPTAKAAPGLLHFAFRRFSQLTDVMLADAPGEWFRNWSTNINHLEAEGARWIARHADGFMLFVDCEALSGSERGLAREELFKLAQRLASELRHRPIAIVWSKHDWQISEGMRQQVQTRLDLLFPFAKRFTTSTKGDSPQIDTTYQFLSVLEWLSTQQQNPIDLPKLSVKRASNPFLAYRGRIAA